MFIERVSNFFSLTAWKQNKERLVVRLQCEGWLCATAVEGLYEFCLSSFKNIHGQYLQDKQRLLCQRMGSVYENKVLRDPEATECL